METIYASEPRAATNRLPTSNYPQDLETTMSEEPSEAAAQFIQPSDISHSAQAPASTTDMPPVIPVITNKDTEGSSVSEVQCPVELNTGEGLDEGVLHPEMTMDDVRKNGLGGGHKSTASLFVSIHNYFVGLEKEKQDTNSAIDQLIVSVVQVEENSKFLKAHIKSQNEKNAKLQDIMVEDRKDQLRKMSGIEDMVQGLGTRITELEKNQADLSREQAEGTILTKKVEGDLAKVESRMKRLEKEQRENKAHMERHIKSSKSETEDIKSQVSKLQSGQTESQTRLNKETEDIKRLVSGLEKNEAEDKEKVSRLAGELEAHKFEMIETLRSVSTDIEGLRVGERGNTELSRAISADMRGLEHSVVQHDSRGEELSKRIKTCEEDLSKHKDEQVTQAYVDRVMKAQRDQRESLKTEIDSLKKNKEEVGKWRESVEGELQKMFNEQMQALDKKVANCAHDLEKWHDEQATKTEQLYNKSGESLKASSNSDKEDMIGLTSRMRHVENESGIDTRQKEVPALTPATSRVPLSFSFGQRAAAVPRFRTTNDATDTPQRSDTPIVSNRPSPLVTTPLFASTTNGDGASNGHSDGVSSLSSGEKTIKEDVAIPTKRRLAQAETTTPPPPLAKRQTLRSSEWTPTAAATARAVAASRTAKSSAPVRPQSIEQKTLLPANKTRSNPGAVPGRPAGDGSSSLSSSSGAAKPSRNTRSTRSRNTATATLPGDTGSDAIILE